MEAVHYQAWLSLVMRHDEVVQEESFGANAMHKDVETAVNVVLHDVLLTLDVFFRHKCLFLSQMFLDEVVLLLMFHFLLALVLDYSRSILHVLISVFLELLFISCGSTLLGLQQIFLASLMILFSNFEPAPLRFKVILSI